MIIDYSTIPEYENSHFLSFISSKNFEIVTLTSIDFYHKNSINYRSSDLQNDCLNYFVPDFERD